MPTKSSWSISSTSICHRSRPHASPHRESARTPQPPQCSGDLGNPALDLTHFFLRVEKVGLGAMSAVVHKCEVLRWPLSRRFRSMSGRPTLSRKAVAALLLEPAYLTCAQSSLDSISRNTYLAK